MMPTVLEFSLWFALAALLAYFWTSMAAKEVAYQRGKRHCSDLGVQFLDDSVALARVKFSRDEGGQVVLLRMYYFEFTVSGERRFKGKIVLQGKRMVSVETERYPIEDEGSYLE